MIARQRLNLFETIRVYEHDIDFEPHSECQPTSAAPGSLEKIRVMCERLQRGEELHHEDDERTAANIALQQEMGAEMIRSAREARRLSAVKRSDAQPKRLAALRASAATRTREAEIRRSKKIIGIVRRSNVG